MKYILNDKETKAKKIFDRERLSVVVDPDTKTEVKYEAF